MKKNLFKFIILLSILISGCSIDLKTKDLVKSEMKGKSVVLVDNFFNLTYVENNSVAFGFLERIPRNIRIPLIFILTISVTLLGFYLIWKIWNKEYRILIPIVILLAGAYGNIVDRAINGYVTDFFHLHYRHQYNFYVFNVADMLINIGVILMLIQYKDFGEILNNLNKKKVKLKPE